MRIVQRIFTLLIVYVCIWSVYSQTDNDCGLERFRCRNGECIAGELLCDGRADCKDSSDETEVECKKILCPEYCFRCNYGGCINKDYVYNGNQDCVDNSDETQLQCRTTTEIRCKALSTASVEARCTYDGELGSCESPVPPRTEAVLVCRNSYRRETNLLSSQRDNVTCNANGQWEPEPIRCVPVCGTLPLEYTPLIINGSRPNIAEFPWHASMYRDISGESKKYFCGASIIQENLLITAAHCVYDENTGRVIDANKIYIVTGNTFRDYDSPLHDPRLVKKNQVKNIYIYCNYLGLTGNYMWDIAILELVEPFVLSALLVPICIDFFSDTTGLKSGTYGKVAGFGRTAVGDSSAVLQALTVPYVPFSECRNVSRNANTMQFITFDKFCAGYTNGSSVCNGDSGSGLVFKTNDLWYLRGIVSVSVGTILNGGTARCDHNLYTLYTQISSHVISIQDIIARVEQNQTQSLCLDILSTRPTVTPRTSGTITCKAPPQPQNGRWNLHQSLCPGGQECHVPEGTELELGSHLIYSCNSEYKIFGPTDVSCSIEGKWLNIPICSEIRCKALSTASVEARCTYGIYDEWVSCESPVQPGTKAALDCRNSYRRETNLISSQRHNVRCNANGQWEPEPIRCVPVCGTLPVEQIPLIIYGSRPNITEFPWHASMYRDTSGESKKYFCGASIIQENLLITAAHCVYDEDTERVIDANKIYIVTGNIFRDYDSPLHNPRLVKKNQVKNIYIYCNYSGLTGNYMWDIAILELVEPFVLSASLVPICIDTLREYNYYEHGNVSVRAVLEPGIYGKVARFGRTAVGDSSAILQAVTVPYIPFGQCMFASKNASTDHLITFDKFCAGYTNDSSICDGDGGSGLVFKTDYLWYLRGIVSVSFGTILDGGTARCGHNSYGLYTKISSHVIWIQDIIARVEQNQTHSLC